MEKLRVKPQKWEKLTNKQQKLKSLQISNMNGKRTNRLQHRKISETKIKRKSQTNFTLKKLKQKKSKKLTNKQQKWKKLTNNQ